MRISDWSSDVCSSDLACDRSRETTTSVPSRPPSFREPSFIGTPDRILEIVSIVTFAGGNAMRPGAGCGRFREQSLLPRITRINADKADRSEEHTSELQSLMRISYAVFCLKNKKPKRKSITS